MIEKLEPGQAVEVRTFATTHDGRIEVWRPAKVVGVDAVEVRREGELTRSIGSVWVTLDGALLSVSADDIRCPGEASNG